MPKRKGFPQDAAPVPPVKKERRAKDQDAAVETAFVAGALPEEDRRTDEWQGTDAPSHLPPASFSDPLMWICRNCGHKHTNGDWMSSSDPHCHACGASAVFPNHPITPE